MSAEHGKKLDLPHRILVIHSGGIGDLLLALPALRAVRQAYPQSILEMMGRRERLSLVASGLRAQSIHSIDRAGMAYFYLEGENLPASFCAFFSCFDMAIVFGKSGNPLAENIQRAGVPLVLPISSFPPEGGRVHASDYLLGALRSAGIGGNESPDGLELPEEVIAFGRHFQDERGVKGEKVLAIHPGSGSLEKNWQRGHFSAVADALSDRARILLISGPANDGVEEVVKELKMAKPLIADQLPLLQLAGVMKNCTAYLGNDSGITHLAGVLGLPTLAIFGPTNPQVWGPRGRGVRILRSESPAFPPSGDSAGTQHSLTDVAPARVIEILTEMIG